MPPARSSGMNSTISAGAVPIAPPAVTGAKRETFAIDRQVDAERVAALYAMTLTPTLAGLLFSTLPVIYFWGRLPVALPLAWLGLRGLITLLRCLDVQRYRRAAPDAAQTDYWRQRYLALLAVDALSWGAMAWVFDVPALPMLSGVVLASMVGVAAVGLLTLGSLFQAHLLFSGLLFAPLLAHLLGQGTAAGAYCAVGLLLFIAISLYESRRAEARCIELLRLRFEMAWVAEQRAEQLHSAQQLSVSKSRFVAVMSHEIRTPLNGILGMTQLLERSSLDAQQREQVDIVHRSGRHLLTLVNDMLDLARIESGKLAVDAGPVNVREAVDDVCRLQAQSAREKGLQFELRISPALPGCAIGDAARIKQVLHNLVGNAIKFTERGQVSVEVGTVLDMRAGTLLRFAVRDTGEGIAADQMDRVFAPFEQARAARGRQIEGSGLGLTISRELARAMGGDLRCESAPGQGSVFEFTLPLQACAETQVAPLDEQPALPRLRGRVLLVDDNPVNLLVATSMLEHCGLTVSAVEGGAEALQRQGEGFDLVLMDCQMPQLDGFETTRRWRDAERQRGLSPTPIVALTASSVNGDRAHCLRAGMDDYLLKPFELPELIALLQRHLATATA